MQEIYGFVDVLRVVLGKLRERLKDRKTKIAELSIRNDGILQDLFQGIYSILNVASVEHVQSNVVVSQ